MKTIEEIRLENLTELRNGFPSERQFAIKLNKAPNQVNQWLGKGAARLIQSESAREVEEIMCKPRGWLDNDHALLRESQVERLSPSIILRTVELTRNALAKLGKPYSGPEKDPELFAEMLRLAVLETAESGNGERRVWETGGPRSGTTGTEGKAEDGVAAGPAAGGARKRVKSGSSRSN
jgi:hypothetical protein